MRRFSSGVVSRERSTSSRRDLTTMTAAGTRCLWERMKRPSAPGAPEEGQLHRAHAAIVVFKCRAKLRDEMIGAGESDLRVMHTECAHALEQADCGGDGEF